MRSRVCLVPLALVVLLQAGCASLTPAAPSTGHQTRLGKVAVVAAAGEPDIRFEGFARGKGEGAVRSAGGMFLACASNLRPGGCSGEFCGAVVMLWLGICGVTSAVAGVVGAVVAPGAGEVVEAERGMSAVMQVEAIQDSLRGQIASAALAAGVARLVQVAPEAAQETAQRRDYRPLAADGAETVLEVAVTRAGTRGVGINPPLHAYLEAHVRLVRTEDNAEFFAADYEYQGEQHSLAEWSANGGGPLLEALKTGYQRLGAHIHDAVFLLYPFPDRQPHLGGFLSPAFGLAPIEPKTRGVLTGDSILGDRFEWTKVDELQPVLRWQAFPRPSDIAAAAEEMGRVRDVRYDLIVARERNLAPAEVVYRREGLAGNAHRLEGPLGPGGRYFWTVRALFELDGRRRVTEWGSTDYRAGWRLTAPSQYSYRFRAP